MSEMDDCDGIFLSLFPLSIIGASIRARETVEFFFGNMRNKSYVRIVQEEKQNNIKHLRAIPQLIRNRISKMERTPPPHFRIRVQQRARRRFQTIRAAAATVAECGQIARLRIGFQAVFCAAGCGCVATATEMVVFMRGR